ncbi:Similar to Abhd4: (Lyso)-N-acylphosphatidylethanolamine lipase (Mus musculus) [Cotesia congregata]|uniref:1-acylglycerol-3-phosphate O-acyltransferase ABHD5 n=1 Tax=Cotesia congregata TaxID=51543 RepID=A0A8J2MLN9_COTCN|nr:Similar to Abhd4: (Lyso)-N-acylphosphatidylethanolamine lipase (Mus musculus) [Cotesia congregata]
MADNEIVEVNPRSWIWDWFSWSGNSATMLRTAEKKILSHLKSAYRGLYVDIGASVGTADKIWTISLNEQSPKTPIVLLHGLGAGVALWCLNLDSLSQDRPVYAIDLLGFGRSSRPNFSNEALKAETQLVRSVEEWRREMELDKFDLLGHSMGGFLAASYAIQYPNRVQHLILADPWGFPKKPTDAHTRYNIPFWVKAIAFMVQPLNPLWAVRFAGPFGQWLIETTRPDIVKKYVPVLKDDANSIFQYLHQCNTQTPSGESAFHAMMEGFGWAKNPMIERIHLIDDEVPITMIYGSRSWVDNSAGEAIRQKREKSYVNIQVISGAGHHVYADKSEIFNKHVLEACELSDNIPKLTSQHVKQSAKIFPRKLAPLPIDSTDSKSENEDDSQNETLPGQTSTNFEPKTIRPKTT